MKKNFKLLALIAFASLSFTSCDLLDPKPTWTLPEDKLDLEVTNKAESFAREYSYAIMQDDWHRAEKIDNDARKYRAKLTISDQLVFDQALSNYGM